MSYKNLSNITKKQKVNFTYIILNNRNHICIIINYLMQILTLWNCARKICTIKVKSSVKATSFQLCRFRLSDECNIQNRSKVTNFYFGFCFCSSCFREYNILIKIKKPQSDFNIKRQLCHYHETHMNKLCKNYI